ncbi:MAG: tetratricopeptide repeat protein [Pseudomonadota bacterium]
MAAPPPTVPPVAVDPRAVDPRADPRLDPRADPAAAPALGAPPRNLGTIPLSADRALPGAGAVPPPPGAQTAAVPGGISPAATSPGLAPVAIAPVRLPSGSPKDQYDYAFDLLKRAEYAQAEQALRQFVTAYPSDPLAGNAQYWLGETYYVRNNYSEAAAQFLKGYQTYPRVRRRPTTSSSSA